MKNIFAALAAATLAAPVMAELPANDTFGQMAFWAVQSVQAELATHEGAALMKEVSVTIFADGLRCWAMMPTAGLSAEAVTNDLICHVDPDRQDSTVQIEVQIISFELI